MTTNVFGSFASGLRDQLTNPLFLGGAGMMSDGWSGAQQGMKIGAGIQEQDATNQRRAVFGKLAQKAGPQMQDLLQAAGPDKGTELLLSQLTQKPTDDTREYQLAKSQGFPGTFLDYQMQLRRASANQTAVNMPPMEREEDKALGAAAGAAGADVFKRSAMSSTKLRGIADLEARMDRLDTSRLAGAKLTGAQWAKALGVSDQTLSQFGVDKDFVGDSQAFSAITGKMLVELIGSGGFPANNFSDADRQFLLSTLPQLTNDPRANKLITAASKRAAQADIDKAKAFQAWRARNRGGSYFDFESEFGASLNNRFDDLRKEAESLLGAADPSKAAPAKQQTRYRNPKTGETIEWDGQQWRPVQ